MTWCGNTVAAKSTNWLIKRTLRRGQCLWCSMTSSVKQCIITTPCQTLRGETVEVSSKQLVIKTPCQTGIEVFAEVSKLAVCYEDTLSNRHKSDCWNFQGSSAACSNVIWGRHRTPRHLAGKLVFERMLHLCPFTIRTPATLNRSPTRKWKIEFLESQIFSRLKKRLRGSEKIWILLREECQTSEPLQLNTFAASLFLDPSVYWRHISGARLPRKC